MHVIGNIMICTCIPTIGHMTLLLVTCRLSGDGSNLIQDRRYHLTTFKNCFIGKEFVGWLVARGEAHTRADAVEIGKQMLDAGVFAHGEL